MGKGILTLVALVSTIFLPPAPKTEPLLSPISSTLAVSDQPKEKKILARHSLDLETRHPDAYVNQVFVDNILLALHYLKGDVEGRGVDWEKVREPFEASFILHPGEIFAFHGNVLPEFAGPAVTMNSRFLTQEGYKSVGGLGGNGVCHLASLIHWAAGEADLEGVAKISHDFAPVLGVPPKYGTSIHSQHRNQNLYIENQFDFPVEFVFKIEEQEIGLAILTSYEYSGSSRRESNPE